MAGGARSITFCVLGQSPGFKRQSGQGGLVQEGWGGGGERGRMGGGGGGLERAERRLQSCRSCLLKAGREGSFTI